MEAISFNYWILLVKLIKERVPWQLIEDSSYEDMLYLLGILAAFRQIEDEEQRRQEAQSSRF